MLREFAYRADRETGTSRWSFHRDFGRVRLIVMDTRAGRVLEEGHRSMLNREEWTWIEGQATGDFDHLLFGTSLPVFLAPGLHHLEAWNEAVCGGAWGRPATKLGEFVRQLVDLEHWAAFRLLRGARGAAELRRLGRTLEQEASGLRRRPLRRRPPRLPGRGRLRGWRGESHLPGGGFSFGTCLASPNGSPCASAGPVRGSESGRPSPASPALRSRRFAGTEARKALV